MSRDLVHLFFFSLFHWRKRNQETLEETPSGSNETLNNPNVCTEYHEETLRDPGIGTEGIKKP